MNRDDETVREQTPAPGSKGPPAGERGADPVTALPRPGPGADIEAAGCDEWVVEVADVHKSFDELEVLTGFDLRICRGEIFTIVGPSGCGKSVTLKVIMGLLAPDRGRVRVFGEDVTEMTEQELSRMRRRLGMVFQMGALFDSLTVEENVAFGLERHTDMDRAARRQVVIEKLSLVGLSGILDKLPSELSGGMRKRVSLARAIALEPELLLWDEPTTGLDPVMTTEIDRLIKEMRERLGVTSLVVTHDMKSAFRVSDRVGVHYHGKLVETGSPEVIDDSDDPFVQQFINGLLEGPMKVRAA